MNQFFVNFIFSIVLGFFLILCPSSLRATEVDSSPNESNSNETFEAPGQMTQKQMNDIFGEDPYLGQTSYLQSPDGFSQKDK